MGLFDKLKAALGGSEKASKESSALDRINELKRKMAQDVDRLNQEREQRTQELKQKMEANLKRIEDERDQRAQELKQKMEEDLRRAQVEYGSDDDEEDEVEEDEDIEDEDEEEDEELVENRAKPIFVVRLKRFEAPMTPTSVMEHKDELDRYEIGCVVMRDSEEPVAANCFYGASTSELMEKALETLEIWNVDVEEKIEPVVDFVTEIKAYNCDIDDETLRSVAIYLANEFAQESYDVKGNIPYRDSLIRIIEDVDGEEKVSDHLAYPDWVGLDDDSEGWVSRMIAEHGIEL